METATAKILDYLKGQSFQVAVVFAAVLILTWLLRNRSAHIRYLLWLLVAIKCLTPPMMIFSVPVLPNNTPVPSPNIEYQPMPTDYQQTPNTVTTVTLAEMQAPIENRESKIENSLTAYLNFTPTNILISVWAAGGAFYLLWAAIKAFRLQMWLKQNHRPVGPRMAGDIQELTRLWNPNRAFTVRLLDNVSQPFVWGLWRGAIYLPGRIQSIQTDRQKAVVMHEMAHVIRWDSLLNLIQILIQGLFWFHPLVWLANRFIRQEREKCCDETAIARLNTQPKEYGSAIIETLVQEYHNAIPIPSLAVAGPIKNIEDRIKTIMQPGRRFFRRPSIVALLIIGCLAVLVVPTTIALTQKNIPPDYLLSGVVVDAATGKPIAGAIVFDNGYGPEPYQKGIAGADGKFEYKSWNEEHNIAAKAEGYESQSMTFTTAPIDNSKKLNFKLRPGQKPANAENASPMTVTFKKDMPLREALQTLGKMYKRNIIPSDKITGIIPVADLYNITSVEQVLRAILGTNKYVVDGNFIRVYTEDEFNSLPPMQSSPFTATLPDGKKWAFELTVIDKQTGKPINDVELGVSTGGERVKAATDKNGGHTVELDTAPSSFCIYAKKEGFVPMKLYWRQPPFPNDYTLALEAGTSIGGMIRDEQGSSIEGVTVYLLVPGKKDEEARPDIWDYEVKTDSAGRWRCDIMPARLDDVWIRLAHPDFVGDDTYGMTPKPSIEKLRDMTGVMIMKKGVTVTGQVRDANGKPVKDAKVAQGSDRWGSHYPSTTTDGQGNFTFDNAKTGSMILTVQAAGFAPDLKEITVFKTMPPVKFRLLPGNIIKGQLVDARGNPVEGAFVTADTWRSHRSIEWRVNTDKEGRFQWNDAPSDEVLFDMGKTGFTYIRKHSMTPSKGDYLLTLYSALKISGKVIDAKTNEPIKQFQLQSGIDWGNNQPAYWEQRNIKTFNNGVYEITFDEPRGCLIQVTAQGYRPAVSPCYKNTGGDITFNFELVKETWISGIVKLPDGAAAAGAKVILCTPSQPGHIENGRNIQTSFSPFVETNAEGRFSLPPQTERYLLVVLHDRGCAEVSDKQLKTSSSITLQPWGRIEGTLRIGSRPGKNEDITIWRESPYASGEPRVFYQSETTTDSDGHFVLERLKAGSASVGRKIKTSDRRTSSSHGISVEVKSGETAAVSIGGTGRPVIGKVAVPADFNQPVDWSYAEASIRTKNENTIKKDLLGLYQSLFSEQAVDGNYCSYAVVIDPDGSFRAEDVPEGDYEISISLYEPLLAKSIGISESIASLRNELKIAAMPGGRSDEPLDVGTLMLKVDDRPKTEKVIEKAQTASNQQRVSSAKEQVEPPTATIDNPKFKKRFFITLVADKDNNIFSDGQKVTFEQLEAVMSKTPDPSRTVLELAFEPGALPKEAQDELSRGQAPWQWLGQNPLWQKAGQLVQKYHLEYPSFTGEDHPESRRAPLSIRIEDTFVMDKDIAVAMPALSLQEDKSLLTVDTIRFAGGDPVLAAKLDLAVVSYPQKRWQVKMCLRDKNGNPLETVTKFYQNSGVALGVTAVSKDLLFFNFSKRDLSTIARFEIELRQMQNASLRLAEKTGAKMEAQASSTASKDIATLEFRVVPGVGENISEGELKKYRDILETQGPDGDLYGYKWVAASATDNATWYTNLPSHRYKDAVYILLYDQPDKQMLADGTWGLQKVSVDTANQNFPSILAEFDDTGASQFQTLTQQNVGRRLAFIVDGKIISAPQVKSPISKHAAITGNFTSQELASLAQALIKGMPPAGPKVTIEARFILVDEAVLKQAGIDLNKTRGTVTTLPADSNDITDLFKNNSLKNMTLESSEPNLLDDRQPKKFLEAIPQSKNINITTLTAPKVIVRNNEYAALVVSTNTEYFDAADNREKTFARGMQLTVCPQIDDAGKNIAVKVRVLMSDLLKPDTQQAAASAPQAQVLDIPYQTTVPNGMAFWLLAPQGYFYHSASPDENVTADRRLLILIKPTITTSEEQTNSSQTSDMDGIFGGTVTRSN